jgi:hypothetical protein
MNSKLRAYQQELFSQASLAAVQEYKSLRRSGRSAFDRHGTTEIEKARMPVQAFELSSRPSQPRLRSIMSQTQSHTQSDFPKLRSSVNTKTDSSPSISLHFKRKVAATAVSAESEETDSKNRLQARKSSGQTLPSSEINVIDSRGVYVSTVPLNLTTGQFPPPRPSTTIHGFLVPLDQTPTAFQKLSGDERMFVLHLSTWGLKRAKRLAAEFHYKLQRPLRELFAASNELGRNYSARSAKRKRPSNSQAASRKR